MNIKKMGIVIQREYLNKVKKKSFLLITFLAPIFFAAICILPSVIMMTTKEEAKQVGVIDRSGIVMPFLTDNDVTHFVDLGADKSAEEVKADFAGAGVDILLTISGDPFSKDSYIGKGIFLLLRIILYLECFHSDILGRH